LLKGDFNYPTLEKGARGDFKKEPFSKQIQQNNADYDVTLFSPPAPLPPLQVRGIY
jgi:hypothetical protein